MATGKSSTYQLAQTGFFSTKPVKDGLRRIASSDALTIYVGAGGSADFSHLTWKSLLQQLLSDRTLVSEDQISRRQIEYARSNMQPLFTATVLKRLVSTRYSDRSAQAIDDLIAQQVSSKLEAGLQWQNGLLLNAIVQFAARISRRGGSVRILTTNYDNYLERAYDSVEQLSTDPDFPRLRIAVQGTEIETLGSVDSNNVIDLEHLHGRVVVGKGRQGHVALAEDDYLSLRATVEGILTESFRDRDLLIVGASLTDAPLISALLGTATSEAPTNRHALFPIPSLRDSDSTVNEITDAKFLTVQRAKSLGLRILFPDFYSQITQFFRELAVESDQRTRAVEYEARMNTWWSDWHEQSTRSEIVPLISQSNLQLTLDDIRAALASGSSDDGVEEKLKLELWVRWDPMNDPRELRLWASSTNVWLDDELMRRSPLRVWSDVEPIRAFLDGHPRIGRAEEGVSRWRTYLSCPVSVPDDYNSHLPVGAITLASLETSDTSAIKPDESKKISDVCILMRQAAAELLDPRQLSIQIDEAEEDIELA